MKRADINFVVPYDDALVARLAADDPARIVAESDPFLPRLSGGGPAAWCYLTYARLRDLGVAGIRLGNRFDPAAINVAHSDSLRHAPDYAACFMVDARADHSARRFAQFCIVQNRDQQGAGRAWIHHWPQPGLIGRTTPITGVRRIGYIGQPWNGNLAGGGAAWEAMLAARGHAFIVPDSGRWHDLSGFDALVAIRSFDRARHSKKPASKLFNAWRAGIPLIAGHDSAYAQVGTPDQDYLVATTPADVLCALDRLDRDPAFREGLIARGRARAGQYSDAAIARRWLEVLEGPVADRFARWQRRPVRERARAHLFKALDEAQVRSRLAARRLLRAGPRT